MSLGRITTFTSYKKPEHTQILLWLTVEMYFYINMLNRKSFIVKMSCYMKVFVVSLKMLEEHEGKNKN